MFFLFYDQFMIHFFERKLQGNHDCSSRLLLLLLFFSVLYLVQFSCVIALRLVLGMKYWFKIYLPRPGIEPGTFRSSV